MKSRLLAIAVALLTMTTLTVHAGEEENKRAENAVRVLKEIMMAPDKSIPKDLLENAHAIAVIPDVIKAGLVVGGRHGDGLISVKTRDGTWSNPSFIGLTGGSVGFQAGPVGRSATASTDAQLHAEIYSYSRSRGLFAGAALDGSAITIDNDANQAVYGEGVTPRRIFEGGVTGVPNPVVDFRDRLEEYTQDKGEQ
jgi:lipid-binding SYLF domain-containing protein